MFDPLFERFAGSNPGIVALVVRDGAAAMAEARGLARVAEGLPCSVETNFRLASLSKQFTAMAILILAENGRLSLDDALGDYFRGGAGLAWGATIRQTLSHTSGLWDFEDLVGTDPVNDKDVLELARRKTDAYFPPGANFRYSNTGYVLLGLIVEMASGQSFADFLRARIFGPLRMRGSGIATVGCRALGYTMTPTGPVETDQSPTSATLGDGGIYSSAVDLFKWDQALYTEQLVGREMLREAFTPASPRSDFADNGYGFGWYLCRRQGLECQWHYGSTCGFSTWIERYPARKTTLILLANRRDAGLGALAEELRPRLKLTG